MTDHSQIRRRRFMTLSATGFACSSLMHSFGNTVFAESKSENQPWLRKTLKIGMIRSKGSLTDKFNMAKEAGFEGVELNVPGIDINAANKAAKETGIIIDGTVGGYHWGQRHTDPDPKVREVALEKLKQGLIQTAAVGGKTMLLVPGHGPSLQNSQCPPFLRVMPHRKGRPESFTSTSDIRLVPPMMPEGLLCPTTSVTNPGRGDI